MRRRAFWIFDLTAADGVGALAGACVGLRPSRWASFCGGSVGPCELAPVAALWISKGIGQLTPILLLSTEQQ